MNKLLLNDKARNHIKFFPIKDIFELPTDEAEQIHWCENKFNELQHSDAERKLFVKNSKKGYQISVWQYDNLGYLVNCIRLERSIYITTIYISREVNDLVSIAKFLKQNIDTITSDYKKQILDARDALINDSRDEISKSN